MKTKILILSLFSLIAFGTWNCNPARKQNLAKIDTLQMILDTAVAQLQFFEKAEIKEKKESNEELYIEVRSNFVWNPKDNGWSDIMNYSNTFRTFAKCFSKAKDFNKQITESKKQLTDLKTDIKNKALKKEKQAEYIKIEEDIVKSIAMGVILRTSQAQQMIIQLDSLSPIIEKLVSKAPKSKTKKEVKFQMEEDD
jgi:hypothetical protein